MSGHAVEMHEAYAALMADSTEDQILAECYRLRGDVARLADVAAATNQRISALAVDFKLVRADVSEIKALLQSLAGRP